MNDVEYERSRCKFYGTTMHSCTCPGYMFKKNCRHVEFMKRELLGNVETQQKIIIPQMEEGMEATKFVEERSEEFLIKLKLLGEIYEKHGKLYEL